MRQTSIECVVTATAQPTYVPPEPVTLPPGAIAVLILVFWVFVCWRLRTYGDLRHDLQHPSEIAPDGCYDDEDDA